MTYDAARAHAHSGVRLGSDAFMLPLTTFARMEDPQLDIRNVVRNLTEPRDADVMLATVDRYFSADARIIHPMLNSPSEHGKEGVKAAYKMLRVLTIGNKINFHCIGFDRVQVKKGVERQTGLLDLTESLTLRFLPLSDKYNPVFNIRFLGERKVACTLGCRIPRADLFSPS